MDEGLPVNKGDIIDVLEEEGDWCWCGYTGRVRDELRRLTFRKVMFQRLLWSECRE
jgi:variant SH3 domain